MDCLTYQNLDQSHLLPEVPLDAAFDQKTMANDQSGLPNGTDSLPTQSMLLLVYWSG